MTDNNRSIIKLDEFRFDFTILISSCFSRKIWSRLLVLRQSILFDLSKLLCCAHDHKLHKKSFRTHLKTFQLSTRLIIHFMTQTKDQLYLLHSSFHSCCSCYCWGCLIDFAFEELFFLYLLVVEYFSQFLFWVGVHLSVWTYFQ